MQKKMTEKELETLVKGIAECFSPTIQRDPIERADYLARAASRLAAEVQRSFDAHRRHVVARQNASPWSRGVPLRESGVRLSEELSDAVSEELSDAIGGFYRPG